MISKSARVDWWGLAFVADSVQRGHLSCVTEVVSVANH